MNILLWVLQILAALLYGASGVMKVFLFDKVSEGVPSFGALPRPAWTALGILELVCTVGLIVPAAFHWQPVLAAAAATVLMIESFVFVLVHLKYSEIAPIILSGVLGLLTWLTKRQNHPPVGRAEGSVVGSLAEAEVISESRRKYRRFPAAQQFEATCVETKRAATLSGSSPARTQINLAVGL